MRVHQGGPTPACAPRRPIRLNLQSMFLKDFVEALNSTCTYVGIIYVMYICKHTHTYIYIYIHILNVEVYIYIDNDMYMYMCVYAHVCKPLFAFQAA